MGRAMRFGVFYELQLPKPWRKDDEHRLFTEALDQVVLADKLGFDSRLLPGGRFLRRFCYFVNMFEITLESLGYW